ncbi:hypothetical protein [Nodosilinea nodulosa]|uniref:hypothetical protein n=1 Tax=Nodosilinea nodulosa TaxID=416001 RepID=UPI00031490BB|nr:hypothetical protein [Nodosilinea nodulosa]
MSRYSVSAKLLALFSGVSILSFGVSYQAAKIWIRGGALPLAERAQVMQTQRSLTGLPIKQVEQSLDQASFQFLTTSAYSLITPASDQPATAEAASLVSMAGG